MKLTPWDPDLRTVVERIERGSIELQPNFQRQEIWGTPKKRRLIDTILRDWSIPPIFLVVLEGGRMEVLDGQQRLAAIRDFVKGEFSVDGRITPEDAKIAALHGLFYNNIPDNIKLTFDQYTVRCLRIVDYLPEEPSELFYRLNQPSMLTAGEQRNAFFGPAREQLKELVAYFEHQGNDKESIGFSNARLAYDDIIARLLFFLERRSIAEKSTEATISQRFKEREEFAPWFVSEASRAIDLFSAARMICRQVRFNKASLISWLLFYSRFSPDEFPDLEFMDRFYAEASRGSQRLVWSAAALFNNRASLRVTDVSSVVYRDICLWISYDEVGRGPVPARVNHDTLTAVVRHVRASSPDNLEFLLANLVDPYHWGRLR